MGIPWGATGAREGEATKGVGARIGEGATADRGVKALLRLGLKTLAPLLSPRASFASSLYKPISHLSSIPNMVKGLLVISD